MPKLQGAIFDVDGVLVDSPHEKAWRESLRELMQTSWRDIRDNFRPGVRARHRPSAPSCRRKLR